MVDGRGERRSGIQEVGSGRRRWACLHGMGEGGGCEERLGVGVWFGKGDQHGRAGARHKEQAQPEQQQLAGAQSAEP